MANKILKNLLAGAGTGLALALVGGRRSHAVPKTESPRDTTARDPLLDRLDSIEARMTAIEASQLKFASEVPALIETALIPRVEDLRGRLQEGTRESVDAALVSFERLIDTRVSLRLSTLETALGEQSAIITALSERAIASDANLQGLIAAVEQLCKTAAPAAPTPAKEPSFLELPFERHLSEAIKRQPDAPAVPVESSPVVEEGEKPKPRRGLSPFRW